MEDQPADSGDLTTAAQTAEPEQPARRWWQRRRRPKVTEPVVTETTETPTESTELQAAEPAPRKPTGKAGRAAKVVETTEPVEDSEPVQTAESDAPDTPEAPEVPDPEVILVPHRPAGKRLAIAAAAAATLFVAAAAFAAATVQPYLKDRAQVDIKLDVARTAANAITTLWTYTPENMDSLPDRSAGFLGGDFANEYRKYIDAIVAPNKQAQVTNTTQVMGAAVETLTQSEATAIVYTNSVATSPVTKNIPSLRYLSYRLTMERRDAKWLITKMSTVTSLDLTPRV